MIRRQTTIGLGLIVVVDTLRREQPNTDAASTLRLKGSQALWFGQQKGFYFPEQVGGCFFVETGKMAAKKQSVTQYCALKQGA